MKTVAIRCVSSREIILSRATKILSNFVSADNGAPQHIDRYLHKASKAFNRLNHIHSKSSQLHTTDDSGRVVENSVWSVDVKSENEVEKKLSNGVKSENGGLVDPNDVEIRSKKKHEVENENKLNAEEVTTEKRKNKDSEERMEDGSGERSKKRTKRKHKG